MFPNLLAHNSQKSSQSAWSVLVCITGLCVVYFALVGVGHALSHIGSMHSTMRELTL